MMLAPLETARAARARLPYRRSPTSRPRARPTMLLRDTPTSSGQPNCSRPSIWRNRLRLCAWVLAKPNPGSSTIRSRGIPATAQACMRSSRKSLTSTRISA
ncbi:hypothetical protein D3C80_1912320 [compost metagenome]